MSSTKILALQNCGVKLLVAGFVGAERCNVRAGCDPGIFYERRTGGCDRDYYVSALHHFLKLAARADL
jgi:hypothetical protein